MFNTRELLLLRDTVSSFISDYETDSNAEEMAEYYLLRDKLNALIEKQEK